jgi:hypothetical protein
MGLTLRQTFRSTAIRLSIALVQPSECRSHSGRPMRITVSISSSPSRIEAETPGHHDRADAPDSSLKTVNQGTALATGTLALPPLVIEGLEEFKGSFRPSVPACRESARFAIRNLKPSGLRIRDPSATLVDHSQKFHPHKALSYR